MAAVLMLMGGSASNLFAQVDTDFWFVVPELSHRGNTGGTPGKLRIATLELQATVSITMPANPYHATLNPTGFQEIIVNIPANSAAEVDLSHLLDDAANPNRNLLENKPLTPDGINDFGLHITSTNVINVYWEVNYDYGSDLWTLKGGNGMGTLFYTPFQTVYPNRNLTPRTYSAIDIVATADNTQVTITLPAGKGASYGSNVTTILPGGTHVITLNQGQTFSLYPRNYSIFAADRLAGTRIESTLPISVSIKDDALNTGSQGQPVTGDQLVPVNIIGDNYIVPDIKNPNHVFVVATENNTNIYVTDSDGLPIGPTPYTTLNRGEQGLIVVPNGSKYARITSRINPGDPAKPIYVYQHALSNQTRGGALVPAIGCTGNTQLAFTRARQGENIFYFFLITEKGNEGKFLIDGVAEPTIIDPGAFTEIQGSDGWVALLTTSINANVLPVGQHLVENTGGIFHLAIINGFPGAGQGGLYYGYYSDFGGLNVGATVAGTNSSVVRACYGDSVQLYAFGGTNYSWTPDTYLDNANINLPTAINLPPGPHEYTVSVSGACGSGTIPLTVLVSTPVVAHFETDVVSGCSPLEVLFQDKSEGTYSWQYNLGDGTPLIRYDNDPATPYPPPPDPFVFSNVYTNTTSLPIDYEITLLAKNESGCSEILTKTITVFPEIHSDFSADRDEGCEPLEVSFTNNSWGDTNTWLWEFGDGGSSVDENPIHEYRNLFGPGNIVYDARLIAISTYNCHDTSSHPITVSPFIEASFAYDTVAECSPHEIIITDQSYGADIYAWDFGDGNTSNSPGPELRHTYFNSTPVPVTYTIKLRVDNFQGCFHEIQREVTVYPEVEAAFDVFPQEACSPAEMIFQNNSTGASTYFWEFGDGGSSTEENPIHRYDRNLLRHDTVFTVMLVATTDEFCRDTATFDVVIHPYIEAAFTVEDVVGCHPFPVEINNASIGVDQYFWDFGDGSPVSNSSGAVLSHVYLNTGSASEIYPLQLIVFNEEGCSDTLVRSITVHPEITAGFSTDGLQGCHPLRVTFTDLSVNAVNYLWDFGDGAASVEHSPVHTFSNFGSRDTTFLVTLTTSTADGECVKSVSWPITVLPQIIAEFTFPNAQGCGPFEVTFDNLTIGGTSFTWDFGDGTVINTLLPGPQTHTFISTNFTDAQDFEVRLRAENDYGCTSEIVKRVTVYPNIDAGFLPSGVEGCHPLSIDFTNQTEGGQTFVWDFGDGSTSNLQNPGHIFTNTGIVDSIYTVKLVSLAPNNICSDSFFLNITVHPYLLASFTLPDVLGCAPFEVEISNSSIHASIFRWNFGDGTDTTTFNTNPISHLFGNPDYANRQDYEITLIAENFAGCTHEISRTVTVEPDIRVDFTPGQLQGCHPLTLDFVNLSNGADYFLWDFGNGTTSQEVSPTKTFNNLGITDITYRIWLYGTATNLVCRDSMYLDIVVHPYIKADFTFQENINCTPSPVQLQNASVGGSIYSWNFGDGSDATTNNEDPVSHSFINASFVNNASYQVTLRAENAAGCADSVTKIVEVYPAIDARFTSSIDEGCHPLEVDFTNLSAGGYTFSWEFGDGASSEADGPHHTFTNYTNDPVTREVHLLATSQFSCTSLVTAEITIHPKPVARFETERIIDCAPFEVPFTNTSLNADHFRWELGGDTIFDTHSPAPFSHVFENMGEDIATYEIFMTAFSDFGCLDTVKQNIWVYPGAIADFSVNDGGCSPFYAYFVNESVRGETYMWDFGDGTSASTTDPSNLYFNLSGHDTVYYITLTSTTRHGCVDSQTDSIDVYAQPNVEFYATPTHQMYPSSTVDFTNMTNQGYWDYHWDMGDGSVSTLEDPAAHTYDTWGEYRIWLRAATPYCSDSVEHSIRVLAATPIPVFDSIEGGCEPHTVRFSNHSIYGESYLWEFGDGNASAEFEPEHTFERFGLYNVKLTVTGPGGKEYAYRQVEVYRMPLVDFRVSHDLLMLPDDQVWLYNLSRYGSAYLWDFGDGNTSVEENPTHLYDEVGVYDISLDVWTEYGCTDRLMKPEVVTVKGEGSIIFPNAFKPLMDGGNGGYYSLNDRETNIIFHPLWKGVDKYELQIYNGWGERLFTSTDVNIGWDGYFNGNLCDQDVYVYICTGFFLNGEPFNLKGDVTLIQHRKE
ncbi:MAG: PKD domain-containing protein [Bacteroidales bacterium]